MGNTLLTPSIIAREALMVLRNNAVMAKLVHRDYSNEFVTGVGDTITVRKPATFVAKEFTSAIEIQEATETGSSNQDGPPPGCLLLGNLQRDEP